LNSLSCAKLRKKQAFLMAKANRFIVFSRAGIAFAERPVSLLLFQAANLGTTLASMKHMGEK
jgi:hypothetical protein